MGVSNKPSYYPEDDPHVPNQPIYATQTAIFRLAALPARSPRSVRSSQLPFMPRSKESSHAHKLAGKFTHPISAPEPNAKRRPEEVRQLVKENMARWNTPSISLAELWGVAKVSGSCAGSKRHFVGCLGGWGDCSPLEGSPAEELRVYREKDKGLYIRWNGFKPQDTQDEAESWRASQRMDVDPPSDKTGGW